MSKKPRCARCYSPNGPLERHHVLRRSQGGTDKDVVLMCRACHREIHQYPGEARLEGWLRSRHEA